MRPYQAVRWGDNDKRLGPFVYNSESSHQPIAIVLRSSGDSEDWQVCTLRISAFRRTLIIALPPIVQPERTRVYPTSWDADTIARLGRDWYENATPRQYGFACSDGHLSVYFGRETHDSSTEQRWGCFLPWTQWRHVRHSFYDLRGAHLYDEPQARCRLGDEYDARRAREATVPTVTFAFKDFDGEALTAITKIEEREWRFGTGWFKWLSLFRSPRIVRSLDIAFSNETGKRKGSWKGGTIGHSITMQPNELHEQAFRRYCVEHTMTFGGEVL